MIIRKQPDGGMFLIPQTDHSRLAGYFAAHWGNETFAPLQPYESVARAATFHDFGYLRYETVPAFDPETGETPMFRDVVTDGRRLEEYQWCFEWLLGLDPYAGLLVSMHRTGLWRQRYKVITSPMKRPSHEPPEVEAFIERHERERPEWIGRLGVDPDQLWTNYRLLQVWDLMSLFFSCEDPSDVSHIEPVPTSYRDREGDGVRVTMIPLDPATLAFDPYPFDVEPLRIALPARRFKRSTFESEAAFRKAYFQAPLELIEYEVRAPVGAGLSAVT